MSGPVSHLGSDGGLQGAKTGSPKGPGEQLSSPAEGKVDVDGGINGAEYKSERRGRGGCRPHGSGRTAVLIWAAGGAPSPGTGACDAWEDGAP